MLFDVHCSTLYRELRQCMCVTLHVWLMIDVHMTIGCMPKDKHEAAVHAHAFHMHSYTFLCVALHMCFITDIYNTVSCILRIEGRWMSS
jgi:hypothetical protein